MLYIYVLYIMSISDLSQTYLRPISDLSQTYLRPISDLTQTYHNIDVLYFTFF